MRTVGLGLGWMSVAMAMLGCVGEIDARGQRESSPIKQEELIGDLTNEAAVVIATGNLPPGTLTVAFADFRIDAPDPCLVVDATPNCKFHACIPLNYPPTANGGDVTISGLTDG